MSLRVEVWEPEARVRNAYSDAYRPTVYCAELADPRSGLVLMSRVHEPMWQHTNPAGYQHRVILDLLPGTKVRILDVDRACGHGHHVPDGWEPQ